MLQYKKRCTDLEDHMMETPSQPDTYRAPKCPGTAVAPPSIGGTCPPSGVSSALEQAQQHLREAREERIHDLETALRRLDEERRK